MFDADAAGEALLLAKQKIMAGAAMQMISPASTQELSLITMLI